MIGAVLDEITKPDAESYFRVHTWRATAGTWFSKVANALHWQHGQTESDSTRYLLAGDAARLLVDVLGDARRLVPLLRDDTLYSFEWVEREAQALTKALRAARLASKLDDTTGRTPEEAAAFLAKAEELRSR